MTQEEFREKLMEHPIQKGIYSKGNVWRFYTVEDAERHKPKSASWQHCVERMKDCLGKTVVLPGNREYKIIGIEDNEPYMDYYWVLANKFDNRVYERLVPLSFTKI